MGVPGSVIEAGQHELAKKCYRNQTAGWLGVVKLSHLGAQEGATVKPYGTVYLSDTEAQLTARAPADAKDNPFVEQEFDFQDAEGNRVRQSMRPLVLIDDTREVPDEDDRYVPSAAVVTDVTAHAAALADTERTLEGDAREVPTAPVSEPVLAPSSAAAVPPSHIRPGAPPQSTPPSPEDDQKASWTENPDRSLEPQHGSLGGADGEAPAPAEGEISGESGSNQKQAAPTPPGAEETAAVLDDGTETGAAATPAADAPEGEFAQHEEVGDPNAPTQVEGSYR